MDCAFCATARLGLRRNLTATEIVAQVQAAVAVLEGDERLTNIVFMGMGEPLANYDNVVEAIRTVRPFGVDVSSGVETSLGIKSVQRIHDFVRAARAAFEELTV